MPRRAPCGETLAHRHERSRRAITPSSSHRGVRGRGSVDHCAPRPDRARAARLRRVGRRAIVKATTLREPGRSLDPASQTVMCARCDDPDARVSHTRRQRPARAATSASRDRRDRRDRKHRSHRPEQLDQPPSGPRTTRRRATCDAERRVRHTWKTRTALRSVKHLDGPTTLLHAHRSSSAGRRTTTTSRPGRVASA